MGRIVMHPRLSALALLLAADALAGGNLGWGEPHLAAVPRSPDEAARVAGVLAAPADFSALEPFEALPAGAATVRARTDAETFSAPSANIGLAGEMDFKLGNALFRKDWVSSPSSTLASDGLGPLFNARACQSCHTKDGRGRPPEPGEDALSISCASRCRGRGTPTPSPAGPLPRPTRPMAARSRPWACRVTGPRRGSA